MRKSNLIRLFVLILVLSTSERLLAAQSHEGNAIPGVGSRAPAKAAKGLNAANLPETLIGMQYETYFIPSVYLPDYGQSGFDPGSWETAEAIPILGKYSSYDVKIIRQHEEWFEYLGIDWLLIDWSNMLWMQPAWEEHKGATRELEETTDLLFKTYSQLEKEGKRPPKLVIMLGLRNGRLRANALERLNGIIAWVKKNYLDKPEYKNLGLYYQGKPLLTILSVGSSCNDIAQQNAGLVVPNWTVRWMGSQLQFTHVEACGFWTWFDGTIRQEVTYNSGTAEATVVTPSAFPVPPGWLDPRTVGRDHGAPYLESWKVAFETRPKFIQIHQWNEFAGVKEGHGSGPQHDGYGDEYNLEYSDDIEPTQMDKCAYRGCGGWGYYYMNLTKALISLYRNETPDITVMALSAPFQPGVVKEERWRVSWNVIGNPPNNYTLKVDENVVAEKIQVDHYTLDLSKLARGKHRVTLIANGAHTHFDLAPEKLTEKSSAQLPVTSTIEFTYAPGR